MASYIVKYVAHYESRPRRRGCATWETKEFDTKWEAEKFLHDYQKAHWYASSSGWVDSKTIDNRSPLDKAMAAKAEDTVSRYVEKMWSNWHGF